MLLREAIRAADPTLSEQIKWNAPSFGRDFDDRVTLVVRPRSVQIVLHRGMKVQDSTGFTFNDQSGLIKWAAADRGVMTFTTVDEVRANLAAAVATCMVWVKATT